MQIAFGGGNSEVIKRETVCKASFVEFYRPEY